MGVRGFGRIGVVEEGSRSGVGMCTYGLELEGAGVGMWDAREGFGAEWWGGGVLDE